MIRFKRGANPGKGKDFEINMLALMSLRLFNNNLSINQEVFDDFDIAFNIKDMGKFDDLVIVLNKNNAIHKTIAVQLKHKEKDAKFLTEEMLCSARGDYSLLQYATSTPQDKITDKTGKNQFILFSNIKCALSENKIMNEFQIKHDNNQAISFLDTSEEQSPSVSFRIEPIVNSNYFEHKDFFDKFLLLPNQKNKFEIKVTIQKIFEKIYSAPNSTEEYVNLISSAYDEEIIQDVIYHQPKLNKSHIGKLLVICLLNPFLVNVQPDNDEHQNQWNVFKKIANHFLVTEVDADIVKTWTSPLEEKNYELWREDNSEPIIVKIDDVKLSKPIIEAIKIIKKINLNKKLIIIGKVEDLDENSVDKFTNLFKVQEKLSPAHFNGIIDAFNLPLEVGSVNNDDVLETTTPTILFNLIDKLKQVQDKPVDHYVSRTLEVFCKEFFTFDEIREAIKKNIIILKTNYEADDLKEKLKLETEIVTMDEFLKTNKKKSGLVLSKTKDYNHLLKSLDTNTNAYFFCHYSTTTTEDNSIKSDKFDLISSHGPSLKSLGNPYIRNIKDEDLLQQHHERINILCAEPGMGKTTLLKFFHNIFVEHNYYSKIISFKDHVKFFKDYKNTQTIESILKYFLNIKNDINEKSLHIQSYLIRSRVCLLFDGLDELDSKYLNNAIDCLQKVLTSPQIHKIFISAREHLKEDLVREFEVNIIKINSIDKNEQIKYIRERLLSLSDEYFNINDVIDTIYNNFSFIQENDKLLGIPLQLYIITEVLIFNSNESVKALLVLSKLYDKFIDGKLKHLQKKTLNTDNIFKLYDLEKHEIFALKTCLDSNDFSKLINLKKYDSTVQDFKNSCGLQAGIVLDFTENNTALFEHQTVPEYLCASYFIKHCKQNTEFIKFIINSKYNTIRYFMDMKLAENSELHLAVLYRQHDLIFKANINDIQNVKDDAQRNLLQLSIGYGQNYPELQQIKNKKRTYEEPKTVSLDTESKLYNHLCQHCNLKNEKDELFGWSSAEYAISFNNLCAINSILKFDKKNKTLLKNCSKSDASILGYSCINGFDNLLDICSDRCIKSYIYSTENNIYDRVQYIKVIHLAAKAGQLCILKKIIKRNLDINCQSEDGNTALHYAAQNRTAENLKELIKLTNIECLKELIKLPNLDINCQNKDGDTTLHYAALNRNAEYLKELIKLPNLDINCQNKYGHTALHYAVRFDNIECLKELIKLPNFDINCQDKDGDTSLHIAAQHRNAENLKELIKLPNLDINCQNINGYTALHYAVRLENIECLKELIKLPNLDITCQDKYGHTALHYATNMRHLEFLENLSKQDNKGKTRSDQLALKCAIL